MSQFKSEGFSLVEVLLIILVVTVVGFAGYYVWNTQKEDKSVDSTSQSKKSTKQKQSPQAKATEKYLSIPEVGIKFQLSAEIQDAYYFMSQQGYIYLSTRTLDSTKDAEGCAAKDNNGTASGLLALVIGKAGQPNNSIASGDPWTQQELDNSGLTKVGDAYYGFQHGNGACWDIENTAAGQLANDTIKAFVKQQPTITKQ